MNIIRWLGNDAVRKRIAELIAVNGGRMEVVGQIGQSVPVEVGPLGPVHRYGRTGLTIPEAFELTYLRGMFEAFATGESGQVMMDVKGIIEREIAGSLIEIPDADMIRRLTCGRT